MLWKVPNPSRAPGEYVPHFSAILLPGTSPSLFFPFFGKPCSEVLVHTSWFVAGRLFSVLPTPPPWSWLALGFVFLALISKSPELRNQEARGSLRQDWALAGRITPLLFHPPARWPQTRLLADTGEVAGCYALVTRCSPGIRSKMHTSALETGKLSLKIDTHTHTPQK